MTFSVECLRPPLPAEVTEELMALWVLPEVFGVGNVGDDGVKVVRSMLAEAGEPENQQLVYTARDEGGALAGTAVLCVSRDPAAFGSLGEVATHPDFRRRGAAEALCARSREDFHAMGGEMLVLGTMTPNAARVYRRTGYRRLPGTNVWWMNAKDDRSPEEWQVDHFRPAPQAVLVAAGVAISEGSARERLRMLALLHAPHDAPVLDATLEIYSTRAAVQCSVNGLYPRYAALVDARYDNSDGIGSCHDRGLRGCWWAMHSSSGGTLVGLASAAASAGGSEDAEVACIYMACGLRCLCGSVLPSPQTPAALLPCWAISCELTVCGAMAAAVRCGATCLVRAR